MLFFLYDKALGALITIKYNLVFIGKVPRNRIRKLYFIWIIRDFSTHKDTEIIINANIFKIYLGFYLS